MRVMYVGRQLHMLKSEVINVCTVPLTIAANGLDPRILTEPTRACLRRAVRTFFLGETLSHSLGKKRCELEFLRTECGLIFDTIWVLYVGHYGPICSHYGPNQGAYTLRGMTQVHTYLGAIVLVSGVPSNGGQFP